MSASTPEAKSNATVAASSANQPLKYWVEDVGITSGAVIAVLGLTNTDSTSVSCVFAKDTTIPFVYLAYTVVLSVNPAAKLN